MFQNMMDALFPAKLVSLVKKEKGSVGGGLKYLLLAGIVALVLSTVTSVLAGPLSMFVLALGLVMLVINLVAAWVILKVSHVLIAALLKGKADFGQLFFSVAVLFSAVQILVAVLAFVFGFIPGIGGIVSIIALLIWLYALYLLYLAVKTLYGFDLAGTVLSLVVMIVVAGIVYTIVGIVLGILMLAIGLGVLASAGAAAYGTA